MILEYEIMKYDGDLGRQNFFVPLSIAVCRDKISRILDAFPSQASFFGSKRKCFGRCCGYVA